MHLVQSLASSPSRVLCYKSFHKPVLAYLIGFRISITVLAPYAIGPCLATPRHRQDSTTDRCVHRPSPYAQAYKLAHGGVRAG
jgi:hypothetical protein